MRECSPGEFAVIQTFAGQTLAFKSLLKYAVVVNARGGRKNGAYCWGIAALPCNNFSMLRSATQRTTAVGFEPTPFRTGALSQRLRPLGQTVLVNDAHRTLAIAPYRCLATQVVHAERGCLLDIFASCLAALSRPGV